MVYYGLCHRIVRRTSLRWVCVGTPSPKRDGDDEVRPGLSCLPSENNEEGDMDVSNFSYRANLSTIPRDQHQRELWSRYSLFLCFLSIKMNGDGL